MLHFNLLKTLLCISFDFFEKIDSEDVYYLPKSESKLSFNTGRCHYLFIQNVKMK